MSGPEQGRAGSRARLFGILRILVALLLLWFVVRTVPWTDSLAIGEHQFAGTIDGDWKADEVRFRFEPSSDIPAEWAQAPIGTAIRYGGAVDVSREGVVSETFSEAASAPEGPEPIESEPTGIEPRATVSAECTWQPGMPRAFSDLNFAGLLPALGLLVISTVICTTRWWRLLARIGCESTWFNALRLTYIGLFFNLVVPGLTGGDLIRGVLVVREHPDQRADALMSVIVDRLLGVIMLTAIAVVAIFWVGEPLVELRLPVSFALAGVLFGLAAFLNRTVRRWTRFDAILERLPKGEKLRKLDRALRHYASQPFELFIALFLSLLNHLFIAGAILTIGHAFGDALGYPQYLSIAGVANTLSSIPIAPGGWGVGEAIFGTLFTMLGSAASLGVATSVTFRLCTMALGVAGGVFLILPGGERMRADIEKTRSLTDDSAPQASQGAPAGTSSPHDGPESAS